MSHHFHGAQVQFPFAFPWHDRSGHLGSQEANQRRHGQHQNQDPDPDEMGMGMGMGTGAGATTNAAGVPSSNDARPPLTAQAWTTW